ncbi:diguanylate cyclase/cyclic diguanylate phosphodiesterase [Klebsiella pneumoniae]|uniref:Diguanylate cyclase/cyclic diguanylate phosphodiesterase n=1 Tax=Klebsiella pneumoniae TaxID=573 RepID=A0A2X3GVT3_KLEPN|nr:diguanylate cyclase/cyclic diguanylate phosphodiesterase [Klebsiella pneumoniae]
MLDKININIKKTLLAFIICLVAIPLARFISPQTIIDGNLIYIAWLPISVMFLLFLSLAAMQLRH